ncbi:MAG: hypothetical protein P8N72_10890 [Flavimaricola sp.]|nr:hypothetical protein [Flavimaricola sp.]
MSLMCTLGLATCITVGGTAYTTNDLHDITYECFMAQGAGFFEEVTFILLDGEYRIGLQDGYLALEFLEERGVTFRWKPDGDIRSPTHLAKYRKAQLIGACLPFIS